MVPPFALGLGSTLSSAATLLARDVTPSAFATSTTSSPTTVDNMSTGGTNTAGIIAGGVIAGIVLLSSAGFFVWYYERRVRKRRRTIDLIGEAALGPINTYGEKNTASLDPTTALPVLVPSDLVDESLRAPAADSPRPAPPITITTAPAVSGLPARPAAAAIARMVSQHVLPDSRPWPPNSILRRPAERDLNVPQAAVTRPPATIRFEAPPNPRHLHLVGTPPEDPSGLSDAGRDTPEIVSVDDSDPAEVESISATSETLANTTRPDVPEINVAVDNPPGLDPLSHTPTTPLPAYSPSPRYPPGPLPSMPPNGFVPMDQKSRSTFEASLVTPPSPSPEPGASAASSTADISSTMEDSHPRPPRASPPSAIIYEQNLQNAMIELPPPSSFLSARPPSVVDARWPSSSTGSRSSSPSIPPVPPSGHATRSSTPLLQRTLSTASVRAGTRIGLPSSPRPVRSPPGTRPSSPGLSRSASAVETHRASGSDGSVSASVPMLWRYPTAHAHRG